MLKPRITLIAAWDENKLIGKQNTIPWRIREDMLFFKETTIDHTLIMGRNTWVSLGKPLVRRQHVVLTSRRDTYLASNSILYMGSDTQKAIEAASLFCLKPDIFVIGGAKVYGDFLAKNLIDRMLISEIKGKYEG